MKIETKFVSTATHHAMSFVKRYQLVIQRAFYIIESEATDISHKEVLQIAVKSVDDCIKPNELTTALPVYGTIPRFGILDEKPSANSYKPAAALCNMSEEMSKHFAWRQNGDAVYIRNGPRSYYIHSE